MTGMAIDRTMSETALTESRSLIQLKDSTLKEAIPNSPRRIGEVKKPIIAMIIPSILHSNCPFMIPITPKIRAMGTKTIERKKILIKPMIKDAMPIDDDLESEIITFCTLGLFII